MLDKEFIAYFKLAHGFFNLCMIALFCYQGWMGFMIRQARMSGTAIPLDAVRRHRKAGPVLALWGVLGYVSGIIVVVLDKGRVLEYPLHLFIGSLIATVIGTLFAVSRRIAGSEAHYRDIHFGLGMCLLLLYVVQTFLGLAILL